MIFTRCSIVAILGTTALQAIASALPDSVQSESNLNVVSNIVKYSAGSGSLSGHLGSRRLQGRQNNSPECGDICGNPPLEDCQFFVDNFEADTPVLCASIGAALDFVNGDCVISFGHRQNEKACIHSSVYLQLAKEVVKKCVSLEDVGGCATVPGNSDLAVCIFTNAGSCFITDFD